MQSMKMTAEEAKAVMGGVEVKPGDAPAYPYGLEIRLNEKSMAKLGMKEPMAIGAEVMVMAKAVVTSCSQRQQMDGDKEASCELQITDMELHASDGKTPAQRMYPGMNP